MVAPAQTASAQPSKRSEVAAPQPRQPPQPSLPPQPEPLSTPQTPGPASANAVACLNMGINSFIVPFVLAIPSILFGLLALRDCRKYRMQGKGMALMGMTLAVFSSICLGIILYMLFPTLKQAYQMVNGAKDGDITKFLGKGAAGMDGSDQLKDPKKKVDYILGQGIMIFGEPPDPPTTNRLQEIKDMDRLNRIANALRTAKTWKELVATP